jgi:hypothetical protein
VAELDGILRDVVADALLDSLDAGGRRLASLIDSLLVWLRRAAEPPRGLELRSTDGISYTGIALFERNVVIAMLAVRHVPEHEHHTATTHARTPEAYRYPDDGPLWRERPTYR